MNSTRSRPARWVRYFMGPWICVALGGVPCPAGETVVIISPHPSTVRHEFGIGFAGWYAERFQEDATVEWRDLGGTTDALKFVQSEFASKPDGIGIDCFFGGGPEPSTWLAEHGWAEPVALPASVLEGIPQSLNGVEIYDAQFRWFGAALSSFGILQNTRLQQRLALPAVTRWDQLADPRLRGWIGLGDPRNSGTMNNMFEAFLQAHGWEKGWQLLGGIAANARRFDRLSSTTAKDVALGETAYAFAIDFYGFTQIAVAGRTNLAFALPEDFTAISPDGICILHGAPHAQVARRFVEFVVSEAGQRLWFLPRGHPGGPRDHSIERMSVRPDFYRRYRNVSNITFSPFELPPGFRYDPRLAGERRQVVAALAGAILVDPQPELRAAWQAWIGRGSPADQRPEFGRIPIDEAAALALARGEWKDPMVRNRRKIAWHNWARTRYRRLLHDDPSLPPK